MRPTGWAFILFAERPALTWHEAAACRGINPDLFFPQRGASTREAKEVCRGCVVRGECLEYALTPPTEKFGIWGGTSERERRALRRRRDAALRASTAA